MLHYQTLINGQWLPNAQDSIGYYPSFIIEKDLSDVRTQLINILQKYDFEKIRVTQIEYSVAQGELDQMYRILPENHDLLQQEFSSKQEVEKYFAEHPLKVEDLVPETPNYKIVMRKIDGVKTPIYIETNTPM